MTDNIGKHVIEISRWGSAYIRGTVARETDKSWVLSDGRSERRKLKDPTDVLLDAWMDPIDAIRRYETKRHELRPAIERLEQELRDLNGEAKRQAIAALRGQP